MLVLNTLVLGAASAGVVSALALPNPPRLSQIHLLEQQEPIIHKLPELFLPPSAPRPSKSASKAPLPPVVPALAPAKEDKTTTANPQNKHAHSPENLPPHPPPPAQSEKKIPVSTPNNKNTNSPNSPARPQPHHLPPPHIFNQQCLFMPHTHSSHFTVPLSIIAPKTWVAVSSQLHTTVSSMLTKPTHRRRNLMETIHLGFTLEDRSLENVFLGVTYTRHSENDRVQEEVKNELEEEMAELAERQILGCLGEATRALREPGMGMMEGGWEVPDGRGRVSFLIWRID